jgi:3-phenylpropionate/cinnamic acid dioxygenase small subunit
VTPRPVTPELRLEIQDLYDAYAEALDDGELERWPALFTEKCRYEALPRENFERDLPLAVILCESRGMLEDRVAALRRTSMYAPRSVRHLTSHIRASQDGDAIRVRANYVVLQTRVDALTEILSAGRYVDLVVRDAGQLRFREKRVIFDSVLVPNSLVYPL